MRTARFHFNSRPTRTCKRTQPIKCSGWRQRRFPGNLIFKNTSTFIGSTSPVFRRWVYPDESLSQPRPTPPTCSCSTPETSVYKTEVTRVKQQVCRAETYMYRWAWYCNKTKLYTYLLFVVVVDVVVIFWLIRIQRLVYPLTLSFIPD